MWNKPVDYSFLAKLTPVCVLSKKSSKNQIEYYVDSDDDWFLYVVTRAIKTKKIDNVSMIIRKDASGWMSHHESQGWFQTGEHKYQFNINE